MITDLNQQIKQLFINSLEKYPNSSKWFSGDFIGIKTVSNTNVGNVGEDFILNYCKLLGLSAEKSPNRTSWDIKINGITYELKTATEDVHGKFQFNHFRTHRQYEAAICLGVSPNEIKFDVLTKAELLKKPLVSMEKNANASFKWTRAKKDLIDITKFKEMIEEFTEEYEESARREQENLVRRRRIGQN